MHNDARARMDIQFLYVRKHHLYNVPVKAVAIKKHIRTPIAPRGTFDALVEDHKIILWKCSSKRITVANLNVS